MPTFGTDQVFKLHFVSKNAVAISIWGWQRKFESTIVMYHLDNGHKPQTKRAERMILPSSSQKYSQHTFEYEGAEKQTAKKFGFHSSSLFLSHTKLLTIIAYKLLSYILHTQNDIAFVVVAPFNPLVQTGKSGSFG